MEINLSSFEIENVKIFISLHPFIFFIFSFIIFFFIFSGRKIWNLVIILIERYWTSFAVIFSIILIISYILLIGLYVTSDYIFDTIQANIASVSWLYATGHPIYHEIDSAERYSMLYGPMVYVINGFFLKLIGPSFFSAKIAGALSAIFTIVLILFVLKQISGYKISLIYSSFIVLTFCMFNYYTFCATTDPLVLFFVSLGLLGVIIKSPLLATALTAISSGICINLKISAVFYFLPIFVLLNRRYGIRYFLTSISSAIILVAAPFLISAWISVENYILWLRMAARHGFSMSILSTNIEYLLLLMIPSFIILLNRDNLSAIRRNGLFLSVLSFSGTIVTVIASKLGAGQHHLIPFIPLLCYLSVTLFNKNNNCASIEKIIYSRLRISAILALVITTFFIIAVNNQYEDIITMRDVYSDIAKDIDSELMSNPDSTFGMGNGGYSNFRLAFYHPVLVFAGNPFLVDAAALMDMQLSGLDIPSKTIDELRSCRIKMWLIPKGGKPFVMPNFYPPNKEVFPFQFRQTFLENYELIGQSKYYDIWSCTH